MKIDNETYERIMNYLVEMANYDNWRFSMEQPQQWVGDGDPIDEALYIISELKPKSNKLIDIL